MTNYYFNQAKAKRQLKEFFTNERAKINSFGNTVNQTFEAHVFANVIKLYRRNGWLVSIINPIRNHKRYFILKFNTRGAPVNYSYAFCRNSINECQIRHGLRVYTKFHKDSNSKPANIVCDIAVINNIDIDHFSTDTALLNDQLIAFGEVKHMSAFAELVANFIGLTHELQPNRLKAIRRGKWKKNDHIAPFLYVSGILYKTAAGLLETIKNRKYDIDVYSIDNPMK